MTKLKQEFKTIHWPSKKDMLKYLKIVIIGMLFLGLYISLLDMGFKFIIERIFSLFI